MPDPQLVRRRLVAQGLVTRPFATPHDVVAHLGAMQGQDLPGVMASIALRLEPEGDPERTTGGHGEAGRLHPGIRRVVEAFDDGSIVRGYPMRGTVFAVAAEDLRWMTELCAGGPVRAQIARRSALGLDDDQVTRARGILENAAAGAPRGIARPELFALWERAGLAPAGGRGYHLLSHLIATGVAVYGPWTGTANAVVLAETWLPAGTSIAERFGGDADAAVVELLRRFLTSHGPATVRDVAWWTKLPLTRIRRALVVIEGELEHDGAEPDVRRYERPGLAAEVAAAGGAVDDLHLLPGFDEIVLGQPDRMALLPEEHHARLLPGNNGIFLRPILRRGRIVGIWSRAGRPGCRMLELSGFAPLPAVAERDAARAFARFPFATP
ncbi:winged helix DNA-binding domain-containing protein [Brachybacterium huguangmaarense]